MANQKIHLIVFIQGFRTILIYIKLFTSTQTKKVSGEQISYENWLLQALS